MNMSARVLSFFAAPVLLLFSLSTLYGQTVLNFSSADTSLPPGTIDAAGYLNNYGITVTGVTAGTHLLIANSQSIYKGTAVRPTHPPNLLLQNGSNDPISFTLNFSKPICALTIVRAGLIAATPSGVTHPIWSAHAFEEPNGSGKEVDIAGESLIASYFDVPQHTFTLSGPYIQSVRIDSMNLHFAGFSSVLIGELSFETPPCTLP